MPKPLIEHAGLDGACVVIGAGEYLEIWNAEAWAKQEEELDAAAPEIAEGLASGERLSEMAAHAARRRSPPSRAADAPPPLSICRPSTNPSSPPS